MEVVIEAAGDHRFDLHHLRQEGAAELLELALRRAHFTDNHWRVQVQKKVTCNAETRPIAVVGYKPWCCYVKIKPGDNNSGHFCTLLMPDGLRGEEVFQALKDVEDHIDRNWRFTDEKKTRPMNGATPTTLPPGDLGEVADGGGEIVPSLASADQPESPEGDKTDLTLWIRDPEKTRLMLLAIHEIARRGPYSSQTEFAAALAKEMDWKGVSGYALGGVFTSLNRRGFVYKLMHGSRHLGYRLSEEGRDLIRDLLPPTTLDPAAPPPLELSFDPAELLETLTTLAQEYAEAGRKLKENRERRAQLMAEVEKLDAEARDLDKKVNNPEVQALLRRLMQLSRAPS